MKYQITFFLFLFLLAYHPGEEDFIRKVTELEQKDAYEEAVAKATEMLEVYPNSKVAHYLRGRIYRKWGHYGQALTDLEEVIFGDYDLGDVMGEYPGVKRKQTPLFEPEMVSYEMGYSYLMLKEWQRAEEEFDFCIEHEYIKEGYVYYLRGVSRMEQNRNVLGCEDLELAMKALVGNQLLESVKEYYLDHCNPE